VAINRYVRRVRAVLTLGLLTLPFILALSVSSAGAGLGVACPAPTTQPFRAWSDFAQYAQVPDGGFEAGAGGWTLAGGAKVVAGNEPFYVRSAGDRWSLSMPAGSTATSPPMCISLLSSKMRFIAGGSKGSVKVQVLYRGPLSSVLGTFDGGTVTSTGTWAPSPEMSMLGGVLPLLTQSVQFRFVATTGSARIDDVYLDPWKLG
jgi:hypothetical protein